MLSTEKLGLKMYQDQDIKKFKTLENILNIYINTFYTSLQIKTNELHLRQFKEVKFTGRKSL